MKLLCKLLIAVITISLSAARIDAKTNYVNAATGSDANDGLTPETAFLTLQAAVDAADVDDLVLVAPGLYDTGGRAEDFNDPLTNRVWIAKRLTLRSEAGPTETFIAGAPGASPTGLGPDAVRGILAEEYGTVIEGFTVTNGFTDVVEGWDYHGVGGGARFGGDVTVSNCVFVGNHAMFGGGSASGKIYSSLYRNNQALSEGGGVYEGYLYNCLLIENEAQEGGGAVEASLYHCTLVGNRAMRGGGVKWSDLLNSIAYYNEAPQGANHFDAWRIDHSCTEPDSEIGSNNLTVEPRFADTNGWANLRLTEFSLCIDTGSPNWTDTEVDFDGNPRIVGAAPDMGAFEWPLPGLPVVGFVERASEWLEDAGQVAVNLVLSEASAADLTFDLLYGGTAERGVDYTGAPDIVTFVAGQTVAQILLTIVDDDDPEHPETVIIDLVPNATHRLHYARHILTILDNDGMPEAEHLRINDGADGTAEREVSLTATVRNDPTEYRVSERSDFNGAVWTAFAGLPIAHTLSDGFGPKTVWLEFRKPYDGGWVVSLPVSSAIYYGPSLDVAINRPGTLVETGGDGVKTWFGVLDPEAEGGSRARSAVGVDWTYSWMSTLVEVEKESLLTFVYEGVGDLHSFDFWVYIDNWVQYDLPVAGGGRQVFEMLLPPGEHELWWEALTGDGGMHGMGAPLGGYHEASVGHGFVDAVHIEVLPPIVSFTSPAQSVGESVGTVTVSLQLTYAPDEPLTVSYALGGTADEGDDYTVSPQHAVTFPAGETNASITVAVIDDDIPEPDETLIFSIQEGEGYRVGETPEHVLTIEYNDGMAVIRDVELQGGGSVTLDPEIAMIVTAVGDPEEFRISEDPAFDGADWQPFTATPAWTLSEGYGARTLWLQVRREVEGYGSAVSSAFAFMLTYRPPLAWAIGQPYWTVTTGGHAEWFGQTDVTHGGEAAGQSGAITHNQNTWMEAVVEGPGELNFWWKVSSEANYDYLEFYVNGVRLDRISGEVDWQQQFHTLGAGLNTLRWRYMKDGSVDRGLDRGWVDAVVWIPDNALVVAPHDIFASSGYEGGPFDPASKIYLLTNTSTEPLEWTASVTADWLAVAPSNGTLAAGASVEATVSLTGAAEGLAPDVHDVVVTFETVTTGILYEREATLTVLALPDPPPEPFNPEPPHLATNVPLDQVLSWDGMPTSYAFGGRAEDWSGTPRMRANVFRVTHAERLSEIEMDLSFVGTQDFYYYIFESSELTGPYTPVFERLVAHTGTGPGLYSSGTMAFDLQPGNFYAIGAAWTGISVTYYRTSQAFPAPWALGMIEGYLSSNASPPYSGTTGSFSTLGAYSMQLSFQRQTSTADGYDLYMGTNAVSLPLVAANLRLPTTYAPGPLDANIVHFWQVVASNVAGTVTGPVWQFETEDALSVTPSDDFVAAGLVGGPFYPPAFVYTLTNAGLASLEWTASVTADWLAVAPNNGTLAAGASVEATVSLTGAAEGLAPDVHDVVVTFENVTTGILYEREATLTVLALPDPPPEPFNPEPPHLSTNVPIDKVLSWNNSTGTAAHGFLEIVAFTGRSDNSAGGEYENTLDAIAEHFSNFNVTETTSEDPGTLASLLANADVFLLPEQESWDTASMGAFGTALMSVLSDFTVTGGVVVVCGHSPMGGSAAFLNGAGLMAPVFENRHGDRAAQVAAMHPITEGVAATFTAMNGSETYTSIADGEILVVDQADGKAMAAAKQIGAGGVVLLGWDYSSYNTDMARLIANAVQWQWNRGVGYDVYLDTENPPLMQVSASQAATSYDPGGLLTDMTYYWRVVASNVAGTVTGPVWQFSTEDALLVTPSDDFVAAGLMGGPFYPPAFVYTLTNAGLASLEWTASVTADWLAVAPSNGTLAAGASVEATLSLIADADALSVGSYSDVATFANLTSGRTRERDVLIEIRESGSLTTTFAGGNGSYGNMFDVVPKRNLSITALDVHLNMPGSTRTIMVYYREGSSFGHETDPEGWILLGSATVTSAGTDLPTHVDLAGNGVKFGRDATYGIYVHSNEGGIRYTNGSNTYENAELKLITNCGKASPAFTGNTFSLRMWNGTVYYDYLPFEPTVLTITTPDQTVSEGTQSITIEGTAIGPAARLLWENQSTGNTGELPIPADGLWSVDVPLGRGLNRFAFRTDFGDPVVVSITVAGALEPFAAAINDAGELRVARWRNDVGAFHPWETVDLIGSGTCRAVVIGDFDNDGRDDILAFRTAEWYHSLGILFRNRGDNTFERVDAVRIHGLNWGHITRAAVGDFNRNGNLDVVLTSNANNGPLFLLEGDGNGGFVQRNLATPGGRGRGLAVADFDHDGFLDLAVAFHSSGKIFVYYGLGDGTFEPPVEIGVSGTEPYGLTAADFTGDGHPDLLARSGGSSATHLFAGAGDRSFAAGETVPSLALERHAGFAAYDFTGDGRSDLLSATEHELRFHRGLEAAAFEQVQSDAWSYTLGMAAPLQPPPAGTPRLRIAADPPVAAVGETVTFSSVLTGAAIVSNQWSFGDGDGTEGFPTEVTHAYAAPGRYAVRLHAAAAGERFGSSALTMVVTGAPPSVVGGVITPVVADAVAGQWDVPVDRTQWMPEAAAEDRFRVSPEFDFEEDFENGLLNSAWRPLTTTWTVANDDPIAGSFDLEQTLADAVTSLLLLDTPSLDAYEMAVTIRILEGINPQAGIVFERLRTGLGYRTFWVRGTQNDLILTLPDGATISRPLGFTLENGLDYRLRVRVGGGLARVWIDDDFFGAVPSSGMPLLGLATHSARARFDDVRVTSLGAFGTNVRDDFVDDFETGHARNWRFTSGTWSVTEDTPVIDGSYSLRQSHVTLDRAVALCDGILAPAGDFRFETDVRMLTGSGEEVILRAGNADWSTVYTDRSTYYEFRVRGRGVDDVLVSRHVDGSHAQTVTNFPMQVGWLLPGVEFNLALERVGGDLYFYRDGDLLVRIENEPFAMELGAFALATYRTDALFDNVRIGTARSAAAPRFRVGPGDHTFRVTGIGPDGMSATSEVRIETPAAPAPEVATGGPYDVDESAALNGTWTVEPDGASATDAAAGIWKAVWDYGTDSFDGVELDDGKWVFNSRVTQNGEIIFPSGVTCHFYSRHSLPRAEGQVFEARLRVDAGWAYFGFKDDTENGNVSTMVHGIRLNNNLFHIRQRNLEFSTGLPYVPGVWYRLRVELKAAGGARYWVRADDASAGWFLLFEDAGSENFTAFRRAVATLGAVRLDDMRKTAAGIMPVLRTAQPGEALLSLTAWNHAGVAATDATTLTCTGNEPPQAPFNLDRELNEADATNQVWYALFDVSAATDDFGFWKIDWDWDYDPAEGFQPSGERGPVRLYTWTAPGEYAVAARLTDHARQVTLVTGTVIIHEPLPPTAVPGGPYVVDESDASDGAWQVQLDGSGSSTPFGVIEHYRWDFGFDTFDHSELLDYKWVASPLVTMADGRLTLPTLPSGNLLGYVYAYSRDTLDRAEGLAAESRLRFAAGSSWGGFGFRKPGTVNAFSGMAYALARQYGTLYAVVNNSWFNLGTLSADVWHDFRIELKHPAGARFYHKPADASVWVLVYETDTGADAMLHRGWLSNAHWSGFEADRYRETVSGVAPTYRFYPPADEHEVVLTVVNAGGAFHAATTTVTTVTGEIPVAVITPPAVTLDASSAMGGCWRIAFSGADSTDDYGIFEYEWDFDYDVAHGFRPSGVKQVAPTWMFRGLGTHRVALRVRDHLLQESVPVVCVVTLTADGDAPEADIALDVPEAEMLKVETGWTLRLDGTGSTGDAAIAHYRWDFGDGATGEGPTPLHRYATNGLYTVQLIVIDEAGRASAPTFMPVQVAVSTPPTAHPGFPTVGGAGGPPVYFDASRSADNGDPEVQQGIVSYFWDMDTSVDSSGDGDPANDIDAVGVNPSFTYAAPGTYTVRLVVVDAAGQADTNTVQVTVVERLAPQALTPWFRGDPEAAHPARSGVSHRLKGVARGVGALRYQWVYGDGNSTGILNVSNPYNLERSYTYTGEPGTVFTATLRVWDAEDTLGEAEYRVVLVDSSTESLTDIAVIEGLWWLHKDQIKTTGAWSSMHTTGWYGIESVGAAIAAFQKNGHRLDGDMANDPYVETVRLGYDWLFAQLETVAIDPAHDRNGNGIGLKTPDNQFPDLTSARVLDTLARAQRHFAMSGTGAVGVRHRHFADLAEDLAEYLAERQSTDGSNPDGWNRFTTEPDTAAGMHVGRALYSAWRELGVQIPDMLLTRTESWLDRMQWPNGAFGNTQPYPQGSIDLWSATAGGLHLSRLLGLGGADALWRDAERWFDDQSWPLESNLRNYMALWGLTFALREALPRPVETLWFTGRDWFDDPDVGIRQKLLSEQDSTARWSAYALPVNSAWMHYVLSTALAIDMLSGDPVALRPQPVISAPRYWAYGLPLSLHAAQSHHPDPARTILRYAWDVTGDGVFDFDTTNPIDPDVILLIPDPTPGTTTPPTNIVVTLRVTDDAPIPLQAAVSIEIEVGDSPFAPVAVPGGPYLELTNLAVVVDGSASYDLDNHPAIHEGITEYEWDFTNDGVADVVSGAPTAEWVWPQPGTYTIRLRVWDDGLFNDGVKLVSEWAETTVEIVSNRPPVADPGGPYAGEQDAPILFDGSASWDPDPGQSIVLYAWDFTGDGIADLTTESPQAEWTFAAHGTLVVRLRVQDSDGDWSAWAETTVNVAEVIFHAIVTATQPESDAGTVTPGATVRRHSSFTATATVTDPVRYVFGRWRFNNSTVGYSTTHTIQNVQSDGTLTAVFDLVRFNVSATVSPVGFGSVSGAGWWSYGVSNTLTAAAASGCAFVAWRDASTYAVVSTSPAYTFAVTANRALIAVFEEIHSSHTITTETVPPGLAEISGAGVWDNGQTAAFQAPGMIVVEGTRYLFQRYTVDGVFASSQPNWNWTFTRADPLMAVVRAEYVAIQLSPLVTMVQRTLDTPVPMTTNLLVSLTFDRTMNPALAPRVAVSNRLTGAAHELPATGVWSRHQVDSDRYRCPPITFERGSDGEYALQVSQAQDTFGIAMDPADVWSFTVDATPPPLPDIRVTASNETSCAIGWADYVAPADLSGFRVYVATEPFDSLIGRSPRTFRGASTRAYTVHGLELDRDYWIAVGAMDQAGNMETEVTPLRVRLPSGIPPPVALTVTAPGADQGLLDWSGYPGNTFGFAGFKVFQAGEEFLDVTGMTPVATLGKNVRTHWVEGLDRTITNWFAVVGFNTHDLFDPAVSAQAWVDPYRGEITEAMTLGADGTVMEILGMLSMHEGATLTVPAGATLAFHPGAGLRIEDGALVAEGTALKPIRLTAVERPGIAPQAGDWEGVELKPGAGASRLRHVFLEYGRGLSIEGCEPVVDACSALYNAPAAFRTLAGGVLRTTEALLLYNTVALLAETGSEIEVSQSIVRNNATNAVAQVGAANVASNVWWGSTDPAIVQAGHVGDVVFLPMLAAEPLLTPAADAADGNRNVAVPSITLALAARMAEAMRISEDSLFTGSFFDALETPVTVALSEGGGAKTLYVQFRNAAGQFSEVVEVPVQYITGGPQITACNIDEGSVLTRPFVLTATAHSGLGITLLRVRVGESVVAETVSGSLEALWDVRTLAPGTHRVQVEAFDTRGNLGSRAFNVVANLQPPPNPVLTAPAEGLITAVETVVMAGTAEPHAVVSLRRNGAVVGQVQAGADGAFSETIPLTEGENRLNATVTDAFGTGRSNERRVMLITVPPEAITLQTPVYTPGEGLHIGWLFPEVGEPPLEVALLRAQVPFDKVPGAEWQGPWTIDNPFNATPPHDGSWYFAALGRDAAGNLSELSNLVEVNYDGTAPSFTVSFDKPSPAGPGMLGIILEASEPLNGLPTLTVQPPAFSGPVMLTVSNTAPQRFGARFNVQSAAGSGLLVVRAGGTDLAGNRATAVIPAGPEMILDTRAPSGVLTAVPSGLIQVTNPVPLEITLMLDEEPFGAPALQFFPPEGMVLQVDLAGGGMQWAGLIELLPAMGSGLAHFTLQVSDAQGNTGSSLSGTTQVELYNTPLPAPPPRVTDLRASTDQAGGLIQLAWLAVPEAEAYALYRQAGPTGTMPDTLIASGVQTATYEDLPPEDGFYRYMVRATRRGAAADPSPVALGLSDRTPPPAASNLTVSLSSSGVRIDWDYPTDGESPHQFRLYRNGALLRGNLNASTRHYLDNPAAGEWTYQLASVDMNGNEALSNSDSIDLTLPAVVRTDVTVGRDRVPRIEWQKRPEHVGVNLYRNGMKLNVEPLVSTSYVDSGLSGAAVTQYEVRGVGPAGTESPARQLPVFHLTSGLSVNPASGSHALLRYFDRGVVTISNRTVGAAFEVSEVEFTRAIEGGAGLTRTVVSDGLAPAGGTTTLSVTMPCATTSGQQSFSALITQALDDPSASVRYEAAFVGGTPSLGDTQIEIILDAQPLAGAACVPRARFYNRGEVPIDIVMWDNGEAGDVAVRILDQNDQEVNRVNVMMPRASLIATPDNKRGFVRIPARSSTLMILPEIIIPEAMGEAEFARIEVTASRIFTACGQPHEEVSGPLRGRLTITPRHTPYAAFGVPEQAAYLEGDTLVILGHAYDRETGERMPEVPVLVGIGMEGFAWFVEVESDAAGDFRAEWPIPHGLSGVCQVWASHPDVRDRLNHGQTSIYQAYFRPKEGTLRMAANDYLKIRLHVYNPGSFTFDDLASDFSAWQMVDGERQELPLNVVSGAVQNVASLVLPPRELVPVELRLYAAEAAGPAFSCRFEIVSPEGMRIPFEAHVTVTVPVPMIVVTTPSRGFVDMSLDREHMRSTDVELRNDGFQTLRGVRMTAPTIPWMQVAMTPAADGRFVLPDLAPGQRFAFQVVYAPDENVAMDYYSDALTISGTNALATTTLNLYAKVTSEQRGRLAFQVMNSLGQVVPEASVRVRNALDGTERSGFRTDAEGHVEIADLMEGNWHWQVSASGHATQAGTARIEADLTTMVETELNRELVTVTFTVVPVPFTDRYEIKIEQTFSTFVPAPVLVLDPIHVNLGLVMPPFNYTFVATAKNHGLIKMTDFTVRGSQSPTATLTPAITFLPVLGPMQQIEIPYALNIMETSDGGDQPLGMASPQAGSGLVGTLDLDLPPPPPPYDPCKDDFMEAVNNLISYLNARYGSWTGSQVADAQAALNILWQAADKAPGLPVGIGNIMKIYQTLLCLADMMMGAFRGGVGGGVGGGVSGGVGGGVGGGISGYGAGGGCFVAGTPVLMADGASKPIEAVQPGDVVRTGPGHGDLARVTETFRRTVAATRSITLDNGVTLRTTDEHRIWVDGQGWMLAQAIEIGHRLALTDDHTAMVTEVSVQDEAETVYTFELREDVAFYADGVLVQHLCGAQFPNMIPTHGTPERGGDR